MSKWIAIAAGAIFAYAMRGENGSGNKLVRERVVLGTVGALCLFSFPLHMPLTGFAAALAAGHLVGARLLVRRRELAGAGYAGAGA